MTLVLHGPSYNPSFPKISPEALATDINNELTTFWLPLTGGAVVGPVVFNGRVTINALTATLRLINLPTSDAGLTTGDVWNNGNFLCVVP
jgi:hypothetical protein